MPMQVILLERIDTLGSLGDVVKVKPGYARNFLLPQKKALRATKDNIAYFETQRAALEKLNDEKKADAAKMAKKIEGLKITIIRNAAEGGQLYGSVTARDIAEAVNEAAKAGISRGMVTLNQGFKTIGLFPVPVSLHPEVKISVTVNIARSEEEAKIQMKTGKAMIAESGQSSAKAAAPEPAKDALLDDAALEVEAARAEEEAREASEKAEKSAKKTARKSTKKSKDADEADGGEE